MHDQNHKTTSLQRHLSFSLSGILIGMLCSFLIMSIGRLCFIHSFTYEAVAKTLHTEVFLNFVEKCVLFDVKYAAQAFLPALVGAFFLSFRPYLRRLYAKIFWLLNLTGFLYVLLFTVINYYYYLTYSRIIDVFFFSFLKEDPIATLKTLYQDYPLLQGSIALVLATIAYMWIFPRLQTKLADRLYIPKSGFKKICFVFCLTALYVLAIRGSLGTFPLRQNSSQVSSDPLVNLSVPNGPAAFHWARGWAKQQAIIPEISLAKLQDDYAFLNVKIDENSLYDPLLFTTAKNEFLESNPPDIVISVQESMSTHMSLYDDEQKRDLLGRLRPHIKEDIFFNNFLSEGNGTMDSLIRMLLSTPDLNLSTSTQGGRDYVTNALRPFKEKGYKIVFVTGCQGSWRDMSNYFLRIGVDEIYEENTLKRLYPDATSFAWGVDDEYMWRGVLKVLREKHQSPLLILTLSISNHPPFRVAANVEPKTIALTEEELKRFPYPNTATLFATFRYANDQLGAFISEIKKDETLSKRTFLAVTGDHNMRGIGYDAHPDEMALGHAVPFYMYIPNAYRDHDSINYDPKHWGSQKDIFATVAAHTLSEGRMYTFGCDLLGNDKDCKFPYAYNNNAAVPWDGNYVCNIAEGFDFKALKLTGKNDLRAYTDPKLDAAQAPLCQKAEALSVLQRDLYFYQAKKGPMLKK